jgi:hypothetical protein
MKKELFGFIKGNRQIKKEQVANLVAQMSLFGWNGDPITVKLINNKLMIIRGQHRYLAAVELGIPIRFTIVSDEEMPEGTELKRLQAEAGTPKGWEYADHLWSLCEQGMKEYKLLDAWLKKMNIKNIEMGLILLGCDNSSRAKKSFNDGDFLMRDTESAERRMRLIHEFASLSKFCWNRNFVRAICYLENLPEYNHKRMIAKISEKPSAFRKQCDIKSYIHHLEEIFNRNLKREDKVHFI